MPSGGAVVSRRHVAHRIGQEAADATPHDGGREPTVDHARDEAGVPPDSAGQFVLADAESSGGAAQLALREGLGLLGPLP